MNNIKKEIKQKSYRISLVLLIVIIILGVIIFKKPSITGKVTGGQQTVYSENLNIQKNESGTYVWQVKNPGSIKSLKATGSVTSNGTATTFPLDETTRSLRVSGLRAPA